MTEPTRDGASGFSANPATVFPPQPPPAAIPPQPMPSTATDASVTVPVPAATPDPTASTRTAVVADRAAELVNEAVDKAGDVLSSAAHKAGEALSDAADKAGDALTEAAGNAITRLRNNASLPSERGHTTIANEVVEKIAGIAAREVPGVFDLGGDVARVFTAVRERLHLGDESEAQGVSVRLSGKTAEITVTIVIEFGFVISSVTDKVREKVISSVENLLGLEVTNVDIVVDDIHVEQDGPVGDDAARAAGYSSDTPGIVVGS